MKLYDTDILLVVDVQNDFCPAGALAVDDGHEVVPVVNAIARKFEHVVLTQDWHPAGHKSFASSHPGREAFSQVDMHYGPQTLWPDHCIQDTHGAKFHDELDVPHAQLILRKGHRGHIDSYSAFFENDRRTPTGLAGYLRERGVQRVFCTGLAFDYCVRYSAEDAHKLGFDTAVIESACRAIDLDGSAELTRSSLRRAGIKLLENFDI